jgi:hypothetical protein
MHSAQDYESLGYTSTIQSENPAILEGYSGEQVVSWYGGIEGQLEKLVRQYESGRNYPYVDKIRAFLGTWRQYQLTGSINRESIDPLEAAANVLAVDGWKLADYFRSLRDQLRRLTASEEQLPRGDYEKPRKKKNVSPPSSFGPEPTPEETPQPTEGTEPEKPEAPMGSGSGAIPPPPK